MMIHTDKTLEPKFALKIFDDDDDDDDGNTAALMMTML